MPNSPGSRFRALVHQNPPVQIVGVINAYAALLAEQAGFELLYLSGAGVANASLGVPDLAITNCTDVVTDLARITQVTDKPILVDIDTGWGTAFNITRSIRQIEAAGAAAVHIEDQVQAKRCGHRPNKQIVSIEEMQDRIKAAVDARNDQNFVIMARTDAFANEGMSGAIERIAAYQAAGADMIFPEALVTLQDYQQLTSQVDLPILANITEFGKTPLFTVKELQTVGVAMVLYPLSAFRAMSAAALLVYQTIMQEGTQASCLQNMQTRDSLYQTLDYHRYEQQLDHLFNHRK